MGRDGSSTGLQVAEQVLACTSQSGDLVMLPNRKIARKAGNYWLTVKPLANCAAQQVERLAVIKRYLETSWGRVASDI